MIYFKLTERSATILMVAFVIAIVIMIIRNIISGAKKREVKCLMEDEEPNCHCDIGYCEKQARNYKNIKK